MDPTDRERLIDQGASARAEGRSFLDNPAFRAHAHPRDDDRALSDWQDRVEAWHRGWMDEDAVRRGVAARAVRDLLDRLGRPGPGPGPGAGSDDARTGSRRPAPPARPVTG